MSWAKRRLEVRVLMVTPKLPNLHDAAPSPGIATMASVARQVRSLRQIGVEVEVVEVEGMARVRYLQTYPRMLRLASKADVIHGHYGYCGWLARAQVGAPVVVSFMGSDLLGVPRADGTLKPLSRVVARLDRWFARTVSAVIVKSPEMASVLRPVRALTIPNGVDLDEFCPVDRTDARMALGLDPTRRYVLFGGKPSNPRKGYPLARAAVERVSALLKEPVELLVLEGVSARDVPLYMSAAEALVMTSLIEGSPNVVKEAMASDLPVIAVPVGDVTDLLAGVEQCAVVPRDVEAIADALADVLQAGARSDGRAALVRLGLDAATVARRVLSVYEEVVSRSMKGVLA
jgi:glycosyltransferase involved in cell wall biosynthesis